jgi:hypothetical protein
MTNPGVNRPPNPSPPRIASCRPRHHRVNAWALVMCCGASTSRIVNFAYSA